MKNIFASRVLKVFSVNNIIGKFKTKEKTPGFLNQTPQYYSKYYYYFSTSYYLLLVLLLLLLLLLLLRLLLLYYY